MLANLLRWTYLIQAVVGGFFGAALAVEAARHNHGPKSLLLVPLGFVLMPVLLQMLTVGISSLMSHSTGCLSLRLQTFAGELFSVLRLYLGRMPWTRHAPGVQLPPQWQTTPSHARAVPVLLVHGYLCNQSAWNEVRAKLLAAGHPVLAVNLEPLFCPIEDLVPQIEAAIKTLLQDSGAKQLALVGHSMGGLVIRTWLRKHGASRVARILTLGSPHQGTQLARWSWTPNGRQMRWQSDWIKTLQQGETPGIRRLMHIALSLQDNVVYPQQAQVLPSAEVTEFTGIGHVQLVLHPQVHDWLLAQLRTLTALPQRSPDPAPRSKA